MSMEFRTTEPKKYYKSRVELVDAMQTLEPIPVQTNPNFSDTTIYPPGSYIIKYPNGQQQILEEWYFTKYYKEAKEAQSA